MKRFFASLLPLLAIPVAAQAQYLDITLKNKRFPVGPVDFHIASVVDARPDTTTIGRAYTGLFNKEKAVRLEPGAAAAIEAYLQRHLRTTDAADGTSVHLRIEALEVDEQRNLTNEKARAALRLAFYVERDGRYGHVYETQTYAERPSGIDATSLHEGNLRRALRDAMERFAQSEWRAVTPDLVPAEAFYARREVMPDSAAQEAIAALPAPPARRYVALLSPAVGVHGRGGGLSVYQHNPEATGWTVPYSVSASFVVAENTGRDLEGTFSTVGVSIGAFRQLRQRPFALLGELQIPFGTEVIDYGDGQEKHFFGGARLSQSVLLTPGEKGLVIGLGAYQSLLVNSELYPRDAGLQLHLGVRF